MNRGPRRTQRQLASTFSLVPITAAACTGRRSAVAGNAATSAINSGLFFSVTEASVIVGEAPNSYRTSDLSWVNKSILGILFAVANDVLYALPHAVYFVGRTMPLSKYLRTEPDRFPVITKHDVIFVA